MISGQVRIEIVLSYLVPPSSQMVNMIGGGGGAQGSYSNRSGLGQQPPKGKNKYTLAPIDHSKSVAKVGQAAMIMPPPFP